MNAFVRTLLDAATAVEQASPDWLAAERRAAREDFARRGLPGPREEPWKYTSLKALEARAPRVGDPDAATRAVDVAALALPGCDGPRMVFVNGAFRADLSRLDGLPEGVQVAPLGAMLAAGSEAARSAFAQPFAEPGAALARLNTALACDGVWLQVADGVCLEAPIHLVFAGADAGADIAWNLRHAIALGAGAEATLVVQHWAPDDAVQIGNVVERLALGPGARLHHVRVQECSLAATLVCRSDLALAAGAAIESVSFELGAGLARRDVRLRLEGEGARADLRGAAVLRGRQHMDAQFELRHACRDATSEVRWRGIADGRARAVFGGAIVVEEGADGSDAQLSNKNLLLSPHAEIDTRPVLEIHADEVKAAHGATVGRLDERSLFYLRSRGVPEAMARSLLTFAFCSDVLDAVAFEPLRAELGQRLASHLPRTAEDAA
jgi:Fe-S cluster assembly protein SufD